MLNEATVAKAKYFPELLPEARYVTAGAGSEVSPPLLDLRRFKPKFLELAKVSVEQTANALVRTRYDVERFEASCAGFPDQTLTDWNLIGTELLAYNLYANNNITNFRTTFALWVYEATVAHKLKHKKILTPEETEISRRLNIKNSVEKGILPLPISYVIEREYQVLEEITRTKVVDVTTSEQEIDHIAAKPNEFLVLTALAAAPGTTVASVQVKIDRDDDADYIELYTYPLSLAADLPCFIPALKEIRVKVVGAASSASHAFRYRVRRCLLTNVIRVRFGLLRKEDAPGDLWEKVKGGVL